LSRKSIDRRYLTNSSLLLIQTTIKKTIEEGSYRYVSYIMSSYLKQTVDMGDNLADI